MVDLYWQSAGLGPGNASFVQSLMAEACSRGFTFIRFASTGFWPDDINSTYVLQPAAYWSTMDSLLDAAGKAGCSLMPSLFWQLFSFPDIYGEPAGLMMDVTRPSKSRDAMLAYLTAFVTRYASNPTIVAWELGNEYNLIADLNMTQQQPAIAPGRGTPAFRTSADNFTTAMLGAWQTTFVTAIHAADPQKRPISSGNAIARSDATWLRDNYYNPDPPPIFFDTREQFYQSTALANQAVDWVSVHAYDGSDNIRWNWTDAASILFDCKVAAQMQGQQLYVGEFGDPYPGTRSYSLAVLDVMREAGLDLGTVWIWAFYQNNVSAPAEYSIIPGRDDAIIAAMQKWNAGG